MKRALVVFSGFALMVGCSKKRPEFTVAHQYTLTGTIVSLNAKEQTASIDAAAVPGFMEAMTMNYPIKSKTDFNSLHKGEKIKATLNVSAGNDEYDLTGIQEQGASSK